MSPDMSGQKLSTAELMITTVKLKSITVEPPREQTDESAVVL